MQATATFESQSATQPQEKPWLRKAGESSLWFNRFKRYRALGPQRSLQAAFEHERGQMTALKSTKEAVSAPKKGRAKIVKTGQLAEVPKAKTLQVPGSWKQASIKWNWVERARAFDSWQIDHCFNASMEIFVANEAIYTLPMDRVRALQAMYNTMLISYNANNASMTYEQHCAYMGRMQSILKDIRAEMRLLETDFVQAAGRKRLERWQKNRENIFAPK